MDIKSDGGTDYRRKELQQQKHYAYLSQLQNMARELPVKYQQRLPYDLLSSLANVLLDGTVFEIVSSLREVQQLEERNLSNQRIKLINEHKYVQRKHRDRLQQCANRPHSLQLEQAACQQELQRLKDDFESTLKRTDMEVIRKLDQQVVDQQLFLEKASVPGFSVTNHPNDIQLQMYLLGFITTLSRSV